MKLNRFLPFKGLKKQESLTEKIKREQQGDFKYSYSKRVEMFVDFLRVCGVEVPPDKIDSMFAEFESSGLNVYEYLNATGIEYREIAKKVAEKGGLLYSESFGEEVFYQNEYTLLGKETGRTYSFLPVADVVVPYDLFVSTMQKVSKEDREGKGEIQSYIFNLIKRVLDIEMTDLFLEPDVNYYQVSYKELGGGKRRLEVLDKDKARMVINALKVMASKTRGSNIKVNIDSEPQSGKIQVTDYGIEIRVEFTPTVLGEAVSMRFFKVGGYFNVKLESLGYPADVIEIADYISKLSKGMVLVSGATGQGKSTFIRSIILRANPEVKVVRAVEDPVESIVKGVAHVQAKEGVVTFSSAIKSFMRANPDIIFVGEVRDPETAVALIEASITGHLTFSTTHATNSVTAILRVLAKAQETGLFSREEILTNIASSLVASFTQRLVKLTEEGQKVYGRKVLPVVEYFVPDNEDRKKIEKGEILDIYFRMKERGQDITTKLRELYRKGYITEETFIANREAGEE